MKKKIISLDKTRKMLEELRKHSDLKQFQKENSKNFCKKNGITEGQLGFLLAVIGAERAKEKNVLI